MGNGALCKTCGIRLDGDNLCQCPEVLLDRIEELETDLRMLGEIRQHGCECSDEEACAFARERDAAAATERERILDVLRLNFPDAARWILRNADRPKP